MHILRPITMALLLMTVATALAAGEARAWNTHAEGVAKAWFAKDISPHNLWATWLSRQAITILHPTSSGSTVYLAEQTTITKVGPIITVTWSMNWQGGMGAARSSTLRWKFTERQSLVVDIVADEGAFGVGQAEKTQLKDWFAASVHPILVDNVANAQPLEAQLATLNKSSPWADRASAVLALSICAGGTDLAQSMTGIAGSITVPGSVVVVSRSPVIKVQASVSVPNLEKPLAVSMAFTQEEALGVTHNGRPAPQAISEWFNSQIWAQILEMAERK